MLDMILKLLKQQKRKWVTKFNMWKLKKKLLRILNVLY